MFLNVRQKGYDAAVKSDARNLATLEETYLTDNNVYLAATTATAPGLLGYRQSAHVIATAIAADTAGNMEICIKTCSASGRHSWYDNPTGGISNTALTRSPLG